MIPLAVWAKHDVQTQFLAEFVNKTLILTCILQHLNRKKVLHEKINLIQIFIAPKFHAKFENVFPLKFLHIDQTIYSAEVSIQDTIFNK